MKKPFLALAQLYSIQSGPIPMIEGGTCSQEDKTSKDIEGE